VIVDVDDDDDDDDEEEEEEEAKEDSGVVAERFNGDGGFEGSGSG
jgi:hypothetical protein